MSAVLVAQGALKGKQVASQISQQTFQFDFVNPIVKLVIFFTFSYAIAKIFEAIIFGQNTLIQFVALFGINLPQSLPEPIVQFFQEGIKGFRYWDFIKVFAILLVIMEAMNWFNDMKRAGKIPSPITQGVFAVLIGGLILITVPEAVQRFKEIRNMSKGIAS